jgi:hypothetical protein
VKIEEVGTGIAAVVEIAVAEGMIVGAEIAVVEAGMIGEVATKEMIVKVLEMTLILQVIV